VTSASSAASPLDGNWHLTGNREQKEFPLISMFVHVEGTQVYGSAASKNVCSNAGGGFEARFQLAGEIGQNGEFTLDTLPFGHHPILKIAGKVPRAGEMSWNGNYTIKSSSQSQCVFDQVGTFIASPLRSISGTFSGQVTRMYPYPVPRTASTDYINKTPMRLKLSLTVEQGSFAFYQEKNGPRYAYLPLTGTINTVGCACFSHGIASNEVSNRVQGDVVAMKFKMDDESELWVQSYHGTAEASLAFRSHVVGGKCEGLGFDGTLLRQ